MDPFGTSLWDFDPFRELDTLQRRLDRLYLGPTTTTPAIEGKQGGAGTSTDLTRMRGGGQPGQFAWRPRVDVKETDKELILHADVPGVTEKDLNVSIENGLLTVSGQREATKKEENERYTRMERSYGSFSRSISLPEDTDPSQVKANFDNGVLEVRVPKPETQQSKRVSINLGNRPQIQQQIQQQDRK